MFRLAATRITGIARTWPGFSIGRSRHSTSFYALSLHPTFLEVGMLNDQKFNTLEMSLGL